MAIKFSQFVLKTLPSELDFIVGYKGTENLQITPDNFLAPYLGDYLPLAGGTMTGSTNHGDNIKSIYGTGGDFEIYHSGSTSYIADVGSGDLKVLFSNDFIIEAINGETCATFTENGAVDLYYDNSIKFSTYAIGAGITGNLYLSSGSLLHFDNGVSNDYYIEKSGTALLFNTGGTYTFNTGNVGIGVAPTTILDIGGMADPVVRIISDVGGDPQLRFDTSAANRSGMIKFYDNGSNAGGFIDYHNLGDKMNFGAGSGSTVTMTVTDGDVGIGTDTPDERLHILDTTGANIILNSDANGVSSGVYMSEGADATPLENGAYVYYDGANNAFKIATGSWALADRLTIARDTGDATFGGNVEVNGTNITVDSVGSADLILDRANTSSGSTYQYKTAGGLKWYTGLRGLVNDDFYIFNNTDSVNSLIITESGSNATFAGNVSLVDTKYAIWGNGDDFKIHHNGSDTYLQNYTGNLTIQQNADDKNITFQCDDGAGGVETYFQLEGISGGSQPFTVWPDAAVAAFGAGHDLRIEHDGTNSTIDNYTGDLEITNYQDDGDVSLRSDNGSGGSKTYLKLDGGIASMIGYTDLLFFDDLKLKFGDSQDLEIYHDGSNSYIVDTGTGSLKVCAANWHLMNSAATEYMMTATPNAEVALYYDNAGKFITTATGTKTTGQMDIAALNTAPASASASGTLGEIRYTADYIYVCTATNTWKRTALSTW